MEFVRNNAYASHVVTSKSSIMTSPFVITQLYQGLYEHPILYTINTLSQIEREETRKKAIGCAFCNSPWSIKLNENTGVKYISQHCTQQGVALRVKA